MHKLFLALWLLAVMAASAEGRPQRVGSTGSPPVSTISGVVLSNGTAFTTPASSGTTIDALTATCSVGSCTGTTFALATTGACVGASSNSSFAISTSNLNIGGSTVTAGSYPIGIAVTLAGASNSGTCYPFTLVGSGGVANEEFVGPFPSWTNVKTSCGAVGNGSTDDTTAIQTCINAAQRSASAPVLYFPAGNYKISVCLSIGAATCAGANTGGAIYFSMIGHDPSDTTITWAGASNGTMLAANGMAYSKIDRITFNGAGCATCVIIDQSWDGTGANFDLQNEYADDVFENADIAFRCGYRANGCADIVLLRDKFISLTGIGVTPGNANALGLYVWYGLFQDSDTGVGTVGGAGNISVYNSIFSHPTDAGIADIRIGNTGTNSFRGNYSSGANQFYHSGGNCNVNNVTLQGNTILDTVQSVAIYAKDMGPYVLLDNVIRNSVANTTGPAVLMDANTCANNIFSMTNTFTVSTPVVNSTTGNAPPGNIHTITNAVVSRGTLNPTPPTLPGVPPNNGRAIFEASASGSGSDTCIGVAHACTPQHAIDTARTAEVGGSVRPVVHLAVGNYSITTTISVPANSGMQIVGDGQLSALKWGLGSGGPVMRLLGPSQITLRDFNVDGNGNVADGIEVDGTDQASARVWMDQTGLFRSITNILVDTLNYTDVELRDLWHAWTGQVGGNASVSVSGGGANGGTTSVFSADTSISNPAYSLTGTGHLLIEDAWHDKASGGNDIADITGSGVFSYAGSTLYPFSTGAAAVVFNNFTGTGALANLFSQANAFSITGTGSGGNLLELGIFGTAPYIFDTSSPAITSEFLNSLAGRINHATVLGSVSGGVMNVSSVSSGTIVLGDTVFASGFSDTPTIASFGTGSGGIGSYNLSTSVDTVPGGTTIFTYVDPPPVTEAQPLAEINCCSTPFLTTTLNQVRSVHPSIPTSLPPGVTNPQFYRVSVYNAHTGIHLEN